MSLASREKVKWKFNKKLDWLKKKKEGTIVILWDNTARVRWDDNTCTETSLYELEKIKC